MKLSRNYLCDLNYVLNRDLSQIVDQNLEKSEILLSPILRSIGRIDLLKF